MGGTAWGEGVWRFMYPATVDVSIWGLGKGGVKFLYLSQSSSSAVHQNPRVTTVFELPKSDPDSGKRLLIPPHPL